MNRTVRGKRGFTLIEVLAVIGLLVFLATVSVVAYTRIKGAQDKNNTKLLVHETAKAVELYRAIMNKLPEKGLEELFTRPDDEKDAEKWTSGGGPFLKSSKIPEDPWGNELKYELQTSTETGSPEFRVYSLGPDKQENTDDDIQYPEKITK